MQNPTNPNISRVALDLTFADMVLPVSRDEQGRDVVPLKPITDLFGLEWERQRKRVNEPGNAKRLGTCTVRMYWASKHREMVCIRLDRVAAYLNMINPEKVRAQNNIAGADFLEQKQEEWDDVIHQYEVRQGVLSKNELTLAGQRDKNRRTFFSAMRELRATPGEQERKAIAAVAADIADELGVTYQSELLSDSS